MNQNPHEQLKNIHQLMERSTRFMSLSGWTGIMAGVYSLIGAGIAWFIINKTGIDSTAALRYDEGLTPNQVLETGEIIDRVSFLFSGKNLLFLLTAIAVIVFSGITALYHSSKKAEKQGVKLWNSTTKRLVVQTAIPLAVGGVFCLALFIYGNIALIAPAMLIFYGIALLNGSKYTMKEFHSFALIEIGLGVLSLFFIGYGLLFWTIGFGVLHIIYGIMMQKRYD